MAENILLLLFLIYKTVGRFNYFYCFGVFSKIYYRIVILAMHLLVIKKWLKLYFQLFGII